ncbi:DUF2570 family protein [Sodalis sp.]|uniref:DUF2570 family protein n=1 Tax=Sodalis sp. (in: enterobacteria) TaxID=1898979 RepID=UPI0038731F2B
MTRLLSIGLAGSTRLLLLAALCLGGYGAWQFHSLSRVRTQLAAQQKIVRQQAVLINRLYAPDAQERRLIARQQRLAQQWRQQASEAQSKYRDAIKGNDCATGPLPGTVLELLHPSASAQR